MPNVECLEVAEASALRKVFYVKTKNWYRCSEIFGSASSSNPNIGLLKPNFKPHLSSIWIRRIGTSKPIFGFEMQ